MSQRRTAAAKAAVTAVLRPGEVAVDATLGNGHDTLFLARQVGPDGAVWSFDVQAVALAQARHRLREVAHTERADVTLINDSHERMREHVPSRYHGQVGAVMFNLGYLPGGDKTLTTGATSTVAALKQAGDLLRPGGLLSVIGYVGHDAGRRELDAVLGWMASCGRTLDWSEHDKGTAPPSAPRLFLGVRTDA